MDTPQSSPPTNPAPPPAPDWSDRSSPTPAKRSRLGLWIGVGLGGCLAAIVLLGLLATLFVPKVVDLQARARITEAEADIREIVTALDEFAGINGAYPETLDDLAEANNDGEPYLHTESVLDDPWGNPYLYQPPNALHPRPRVYTLGKDGVPGGRGEDADIDSDRLPPAKE